ncbi:sensor histidine kinase [Flavobacterium album]|nr:ATP-binding protein [Flavobacterium album]
MTFIPMAVYSAIGFVLLSVSASLMNYNLGITGLFTGNLIGNIMARKLFLQMLVAILVIGTLRIVAHRKEWLSPEFGSALLIIIFIVITLALIWKTSTTLNKIDDKKRIAVENFRIAIESAPYALVISDRDGKILSVNQQTKILYRYHEHELIGMPVMNIIPKKMHTDYVRRREQFFADNHIIKMGHNEDMLALRKDGTEFPIEIILVPIKTSTGPMCLASVIDITQRKNQEDTIKKQLIELQVKNEELEQFNYISSHDLQEPLRTVSNYISMLQEDFPDRIDGEIQEHLKTMGSAIDRMSHVVRSLLNFGKLGRKKKLVLTDCNKLVNDVAADLNSLIKNTGTEITVTCGLPEFYAYETELRQLFQNLISNAIKFRKSSISPDITISSRKLDGFYEFSVEDNGIGIHPKHSDSIFRIFHRLNSDEEYEGYGIGLANCKKIVEMHGGKIWVESEPGKGSTFKFTLLNFNK